ncbi:hypothetical protein HQ544_01250 [Candidatus Falkowbacteria bacterium]|nr:hypothetical protein [Candidatus Falkowbacteria bacterium]
MDWLTCLVEGRSNEKLAEEILLKLLEAGYEVSKIFLAVLHYLERPALLRLYRHCYDTESIGSVYVELALTKQRLDSVNSQRWVSVVERTAGPRDVGRRSPKLTPKPMFSLEDSVELRRRRTEEGGG